MHRILIIGIGGIGERHTRCFLATNRAKVGICEPVEGRRADAAKRYDIPWTYASLDQALARTWDAAVVASPAQTHVPIALRLAKVGMALLIEKPLSTGLEGVTDLIEEVERRRLPAAVAYTMRAHPALAAMKRALGQGRFGRPVQVILVSGHHWPAYRPDYRRLYFTDRSTGGGAIQDQMTHWLNAGEWLLGRIERVAADAEHKVLDGVAVEDTVNLLARHGPVMGCYCLNLHQAPYEVTFTVVCERGTLRFEAPGHQWRWKAAPDGPSETQPWHVEPEQIKERDELFVRQANAFMDFAEGKGPPLCSLREALQTLRVNLAALRSTDQGGTWQAITAHPTQGRSDQESPVVKRVEAEMLREDERAG